MKSVWTLLLLSCSLTRRINAGTHDDRNRLRSLSTERILEETTTAPTVAPATTTSIEVVGQSTIPFIEEDGLVVMEAESVPVVEPWVIENTVDDYTGQAYYRFDGNTVQTGPPLGTISYYIYITNPGEYRMSIRAYKNNVDNTWSNDCYTRLVNHPGYAGGTIKTYLPGPSFKWNYNTYHEYHDSNGITYKPLAKYTFPTSGIYELQVSGRSKGYHIDRIVLFDESKVNETLAHDENIPESIRQTPSPAASPTNGGLAYIIKFTLTTAGTDNDSVVGEINDGDIIDLMETGTGLSIIAETIGTIIGSVVFYFEDKTHTESGAPYAMVGNRGNEFYPAPYLATTGNKTVLAIAYDDDNVELGSLEIDFTIIDSSITATPTTTPTTATPTTAAPVSTAPTTASPVDTPTTAAPTATPTTASPMATTTTASPMATTTTASPMATTTTAEPMTTPTPAPVVTTTNAPATTTTTTQVPAVTTTTSSPVTSGILPVGTDAPTPENNNNNNQDASDVCPTNEGSCSTLIGSTGVQMHLDFLGFFCLNTCAMEFLANIFKFLSFECGSC